MSTMIARRHVDDRALREIDACTSCESDRMPRMYVCTYHEGWMDGYDRCEAENGIA